MWTDICYLGIESEDENSLGEKYTQVAFNDFVFCDEQSIRMSEFYSAAVTDFKPTLTLIVKQADYADQRFIQYYGDVFTVIRTYKVNSEDIELTLERGITHGDAQVSDEGSS